MDRDGTQVGYDIDLMSNISLKVNIPVIASGGAGNLDHLADGLKLGTNIYDKNYLVGRLIELNFKSSRVLLLSDLNSKIPVLLEPIMLVEVTAPDEIVGAVIGDLNSRRGRILGMDVPCGANCFLGGADAVLGEAGFTVNG